MSLRLKKRGEKALERALVAVPDDDEIPPLKRQDGSSDVEPSSPGSASQHRREVAEVDHEI
jgi:hypothetical protein